MKTGIDRNGDLYADTKDGRAFLHPHYVWVNASTGATMIGPPKGPLREPSEAEVAMVKLLMSGVGRTVSRGRPR